MFFHSPHATRYRALRRSSPSYKKPRCTRLRLTLSRYARLPLYDHLFRREFLTPFDKVAHDILIEHFDLPSDLKEGSDIPSNFRPIRGLHYR